MENFEISNPQVSVLVSDWQNKLESLINSFSSQLEDDIFEQLISDISEFTAHTEDPYIHILPRILRTPSVKDYNFKSEDLVNEYKQHVCFMLLHLQEIGFDWITDAELDPRDTSQIRLSKSFYDGGSQEDFVKLVNYFSANNRTPQYTLDFNSTTGLLKETKNGKPTGFTNKCSDKNLAKWKALAYISENPDTPLLYSDIRQKANDKSFDIGEMIRNIFKEQSTKMKHSYFPPQRGSILLFKPTR